MKSLKCWRLFKWLRPGRCVPAKPYPQTIDRMIESYPRLFTDRRFGEWRMLFDDNAVVGRTGPDGRTWTMDIEQSTKSQQTFAANKASLSEKWDNVKVTSYGRIAVVAADYTLQADNDQRTGTDVLLLMQGIDGWRIVGLAYDEKDR